MLKCRSSLKNFYCPQKLVFFFQSQRPSQNAYKIRTYFEYQTFIEFKFDYFRGLSQLFFYPHTYMMFAKRKGKNEAWMDLIS